MKRQPASIVITADGPDTSLHACVESLRGSLVVRDELIVVTRGKPLRRIASAQCVVAAMGATIEELRLLGAELGSRRIVVFVDADTVAPPHAVDQLVAALDDPEVRLAVPVSDLSYGRAQVAAPIGSVKNNRTLREHARTWLEQHRGTSWDQHLVGSAVLAVRRSDVARVLASGDGRFGCNMHARVLGDLYWHHAGTDECSLLSGAQPFLSASYIVKDEERTLAESLRSVASFADEVVVYDTGSSDRTVQIATDAGAIVVEGYWDEHFGNARNRSLAHCTGSWVLAIDGDEQLAGDREALRDLLRGNPTAEILALEIHSLQGNGYGAPEIALVNRLVRRGRAVCVGRVHEQFVALPGEQPHSDLTRLVHLEHSGYRDDVIAVKDKVRRNLRLSELEHADGYCSGMAPGEALSNHLKALVSADRDAEALLLAAMHWGDPATDSARSAVAQRAAEAALASGRLDEAELWVGRLRELPGTTARPDALEAVLLLRRGDYKRSASLFSRLPVTESTTQGWTFRRADYLSSELAALRTAGRLQDAVELLLVTAARADAVPPLIELLPVFDAASRDIADLALAYPEGSRTPAAAQARDLPQEDARRVLDRLFVSDELDLAVLVAGCLWAATATVPDALEWAVRLRARGLTDGCPLLTMADDRDRSPRDRALAAASALEFLDDQRAHKLFLQAAAEVPEDQAAHVTTELTLLVPRVAATYLAEEATPEEN